MTRWLVSLALCVTLAAGVLIAQDAADDGAEEATQQVTYEVPQPSVVPPSWELEFSCKTPMRTVQPSARGGEPVYYWYFLYTVSNPDDREVFWLPRIQLLTDELELVDAKMAVPVKLFRQIKELHKAKYLEDPLQVSGPLLSGSDNARDSVAIFALKKDPSQFKIFIEGLSGEQQPMEVKVGNETRKVTMAKVRMLEFKVPGHTPADRSPDVVKVDENWIMRPVPPKTTLEVDLEKAAAGKPGEAILENGRPLGSAPTTQPEGN